MRTQFKLDSSLGSAASFPHCRFLNWKKCGKRKGFSSSSSDAPDGEFGNLLHLLKNLFFLQHWVQLICSVKAWVVASSEEFLSSSENWACETNAERDSVSSFSLLQPFAWFLYVSKIASQLRTNPSFFFQVPSSFWSFESFSFARVPRARRYFDSSDQLSLGIPGAGRLRFIGIYTFPYIVYPPRMTASSPTRKANEHTVEKHVGPPLPILLLTAPTSSSIFR